MYRSTAAIDTQLEAHRHQNGGRYSLLEKVFDGDLAFSTNNYVLLENYRPELPILCVQRKAAKKVVVESDYIQSNINSFGDDIGKITNRITTMYDVQSQYEVGSKEFEVLDYRIRCGQLYQQNAIDRTKGILTTSMPKEWYDRGACRAAEDDDAIALRRKAFNAQIVAADKPYFMSYVYPAQMKKYRAYLNNTRLKSRQEFELQIDEIMMKPAKDITEAERTFINYYFYKMPVGINGCVMNELCWMVEEAMDQHRRHLKETRGFAMGALKTADGYTKLHFTKISNLYNDYTRKKRRLMQLPAMGAKTGKSERAAACDMYDQFREGFAREATLICNNEDELCNILLDLCDKNQSAKAFVWDLVPEVLVRRLLCLKGGIHLIVPCKEGDVQYAGCTYEAVFREVQG